MDQLRNMATGNTLTPTRSISMRCDEGCTALSFIFPSPLSSLLHPLLFPSLFCPHNSLTQRLISVCLPSHRISYCFQIDSLCHIPSSLPTRITDSNYLGPSTINSKNTARTGTTPPHRIPKDTYPLYGDHIRNNVQPDGLPHPIISIHYHRA